MTTPIHELIAQGEALPDIWVQSWPRMDGGFRPRSVSVHASLSAIRYVPASRVDDYIKAQDERIARAEELLKSWLGAYDYDDFSPIVGTRAFLAQRQEPKR